MREHQSPDGLTFKGVFASNQLPSFSLADLATGFCLIANYDPAFKPGSHWVGIRVEKSRVGEPASHSNATTRRERSSIGTRRVSYFDSYGQKPDEDDSVVNDKTRFQDYIKLIPHNSFSYNEYDLQSVGTDVCGLYAVYFCLNDLPIFNPDAWHGFYFYKKAEIRNGTVSVRNPGSADNDRLIQSLVNIHVAKSPISTEQSGGSVVRSKISGYTRGDIQSIRFERSKWTIQEASIWLGMRHIKPIKEVDVTAHQLRFRLTDPDEYKEFRYKEFGDGISVILGYK